MPKKSSSSSAAAASASAPQPLADSSLARGEQELKLEDTNLANYDSPEAQQARKDAAKSEKQFTGAGEQPGLMIWRVENRRTAGDVPDFGVNKWPENMYGQFHTGDSYVVLNTYLENSKSKKLLHDVHFWLGKESSQDEIGVAAYKAVELDDLLDGAPVQHREVEGAESHLFKSYFKNGIMYLQGGIASGFRPAKPEEYVPRLFHIKSDSGRRNVVAYEVEPKFASLSQGDVFILDLGSTIYVFAGDCSDAFEKNKGSVMASNLRLSRGGTVRMLNEPDDAFWKALGGGKSKEDVPMKMTTSIAPLPASTNVNVNNIALHRLTDESGEMKFLKVHQGRVYPSMLRAKDVFILDSGPEIFVWVGMDASADEKKQAMDRAMIYLKTSGKPASTAITRVIQGETNKAFDEIVYAGNVRKGWLARSVGAQEDDIAFSAVESFISLVPQIFESCSGTRDIASQVEREWNIIDRSTLERAEDDAPPPGAKPLDVRL